VRPWEEPALRVLERYWKISCSLDSFSCWSAPSRIDDRTEAGGGEEGDTGSEAPFLTSAFDSNSSRNCQQHVVVLKLCNLLVKVSATATLRS